MVSIRKTATTQISRKNNRGHGPVRWESELQLRQKRARKIPLPRQSLLVIPTGARLLRPVCLLPGQPGFFLRAAVARVGLRSGGTAAQSNRHARNEPPLRFHALLRGAGFTPPLFKFFPRLCSGRRPWRAHFPSDCGIVTAYRDLSTAIRGNGLQLEEHHTSPERIPRNLELGRSIATQPICFLAALEINLILHGFLNIGRQQIVANHLSIANENQLPPKLCAIERQTDRTTPRSRRHDVIEIEHPVPLKRRDLAQLDDAPGSRSASVSYGPPNPSLNTGWRHTVASGNSYEHQQNC